LSITNFKTIKSAFIIPILLNNIDTLQKNKYQNFNANEI